MELPTIKLRTCASQLEDFANSRLAVTLHGIAGRTGHIFSRAPSLHQVRTIHVAPSSDELVLLVRARLEKWDAVMITSKVQKWIGPCGKGRRGFFETICGDWNMAD